MSTVLHADSGISRLCLLKAAAIIADKLQFGSYFENGIVHYGGRRRTTRRERPCLQLILHPAPRPLVSFAVSELEH